MTGETDDVLPFSPPPVTEESRERRPGPRPPAREVGQPDTEPLFSLEPIARWGKFTRRAVRRHWVVAVIVFVVTTILGGMLLVSSPPLYQTSATILLAGDQVLGGTEGVTVIASRQAESVIHRRESLDAMIEEQNLATREVDPPFFGRLRDGVLEMLTGAESEENKMIRLRNQLRTSVLVLTNEQDSSIDISVQWPDPAQAAALAQQAFEIFLAERTRVEVEPLEEAVAILQNRSAQTSAYVNSLRGELDLTPGDGAPAGSALEGAVRVEQDVLAQLRQAELELAEAQAGIPFRYALLAPPERPLQPVSGNLTGYLATLLLALAVTAIICLSIDAPRGRVVAPWQLEHLNVRVLSVIEPTDIAQ